MKKKTLIPAALIAAMMSLSMEMGVFAAGNGSITVQNATKNITYEAYKILDATYSGTNGENVAYTVDGAHKDLLSDEIFTTSGTADADGNYGVTLKEGKQIEDITDWLSDNYESFAPAKELSFDDQNSTASVGNLDYGYYYITSSMGSVVSVDNVTPNALIYDKNEGGPNQPEKLITEEDAVIDISDKTGINAHSNEAAVGSVEKFLISFNAVNWKTEGSGNNVSSVQMRKYTIIDTPVNIAINQDSVQIEIQDNVVSTEDDTKPTWSVAEDGKLTVNIPWIDADNNSLYNAKDNDANIAVRISYTGVVLPGAVETNGQNDVQVKYNDNFEIEAEEGKLHTDTYVYKFKLKKVEANTETLLENAEFEILLGGTKLHFVEEEGGDYRVAGSSEEGSETITVRNGNVIIKGLDKQDYVLREVKAPLGYNLAADTEISKELLKKADDEIVDAEGTEEDQGVVTVEDVKGILLPTTGGVGTTIFKIIGSSLIVMGFVVLKSRKRRENEMSLAI